jgi:hypothetical protein
VATGVESLSCGAGRGLMLSFQFRFSPTRRARRTCRTRRRLTCTRILYRYRDGETLGVGARHPTISSEDNGE